MKYEANRQVAKLGVMESKRNMTCVGYITATEPEATRITGCRDPKDCNTGSRLEEVFL
jgi:hypothetical protein